MPHITKYLAPAAIALLMLLGGCGTHKPTTRPADGLHNQDPLQFKDLEGHTIATGILTLPSPLPESGEFAGRWMILHAEEDALFRARQSGNYAGQSHNGAINIDLSPHMADNNVLLVGAITGGTISGEWLHATIAGPQKMGTFTLRVDGLRAK